MGSKFTVPGMTQDQARKVADLLQKQLSTYNDLHLTLKHVHWNVVGPNFIGVHEMIDLLEPVRPHRYRAVRLLEASGLAYEPRRGARLPVQQISKM